MNQSSTRIFVDTNVVIYALDVDATKAKIAQSIIAERPRLSVQVINESTNVQIKKLKRTIEDALTVASFLMSHCEVLPITVADVQLSHQLIAGHGFSLWDSLIVATAINAGCTQLFSEDMQHGRLINGQLLIKNPFLTR